MNVIIIGAETAVLANIAVNLPGSFGSKGGVVFYILLSILDVRLGSV